MVAPASGTVREAVPLLLARQPGVSGAQFAAARVSVAGISDRKVATCHPRQSHGRRRPLLFSSLSRALCATGSAAWVQTCATIASLVVSSQWGCFCCFYFPPPFFLNFSKLNLRNRKERPNQVGRAGSGRHSFSGARSCCLRLPAFCQRRGPPRTFASFLAVSLATLGRRAVWQELNRNRFSRRCL